MATATSKRKMGIDSFLNGLMRRRRLLPSQLATELGVSHATVHRWLAGDDIPKAQSCYRLAEYSGVPLQKVLVSMGHIPETRDKGESNWPEFREYAENKYPKVLDEDMVTLIEDLIERKRQKKRRKKSNVGERN
ncbi:helix-turn-helix domain-containing protein [Chloroflexota bacterium]